MDNLKFNRFIIIVTGEDRPGVLDDVCGVIQRNSGTIQVIRSVDSGGQFAMLYGVAIAASATEALCHQLDEFAGYSGLSVVCRPAADSRPVHQYRFVARGDDHTGVLKKISHLLRVLSINVEEIQTQVEPDNRVTMTLLLGVPRECPVTKVKEFFAQLLGPIDMTWELTPA